MSGPWSDWEPDEEDQVPYDKNEKFMEYECECYYIEDPCWKCRELKLQDAHDAMDDIDVDQALKDIYG